MDGERRRKQRVVYWDELPDLVVEKIFCYLPKRSRFNAAVTCKSWLRVLNFPELWKTFVLKEKTLTRSKYNYFLGKLHAI
ncbi:hypothetical protein RvY_10033 [Ramazzottius varieornatus]|uniref:F-box domain-containing protein n=1 Tax=Ramazzottius varieornatus TaxID=947166 RepID=A0A1D1VDU3_RAMVA|nr:hypothetical protein RvY_10033 [Ramazzottius varieornatus]